ncbi:MAG: hypothetical protein QXK24_08390 [Ignisphaera sp.]
MDRFKLLLFPLMVMFLCAFISSAETNINTSGVNATGQIQYNNTNIPAQLGLFSVNTSLTSFLPIIFITAIAITIALSLQVFGSGLSGIGVYITIVLSIGGIIWIVLSGLGGNIILNIPGIGWIIYFALTLSYFIGLLGFITPMGGG